MMRCRLHYLALALALTVGVSSAHAGEECTLSLGMSPAVVEQALGVPDWQRDQAWDYFNAGVEVIFQDQRLYAVRFKIGSPFIPQLLTTAHLNPGSPRQLVKGLGPAFDHDTGQWVTDLYTDNRTFALAANYSKINGTLENVLVRQEQFVVYCAPQSGHGSREMFRTWYKLGASIGAVLRSHASRSQPDADRARAEVETELREVQLGGIPLAAAPFRCCSPDPANPAATLRDWLFSLAAENGRTSGIATPTLALYTGMYLSLEEATLSSPSTTALGGGNEGMLNHFEGIALASYPYPPAVIEPQIGALLSALRGDGPDSAISAAASRLTATFLAD